MVQFLAWLTGVLIFVESSISVLTVGTLYRPIFDKMGIPREKLAYIADSSSAPSSILIPSFSKNMPMTNSQTTLT